MNPRIILFLVFLVPFLIGCMGGDRFTAHPWSGLAISEDEELLYVSTGDGKLKVFDSDNGKLVAEYPNSDAGDTGIGQFYSSPTVYEDWVFVASYQKDKEKCGTGDKSGTAPCGRIYGLKWIQDTDGDSRRLRRQWVFPSTREEAKGAFVGSPAVMGDILVAGSSDKKLYAINFKDDGKLKWTFDGANDKIWSTPTIAEGIVYFGSLDHHLYAIDLANGEQLWSYPSKGAITSRPVVTDDILYFGSFDKHIYALDVNNRGAELDSFLGDDWFWADLVTDGDLLYAGTLAGTVYGLSLPRLKEEWVFPANIDFGSIVAAPVLAGYQVGIFSDEGRFVFLDRDDGEEEWTAAIESEEDISVRSAPVAFGDSVAVMTVNCSLHRLNWKLGKNKDREFDWVEKADVCE
jgi:outer membrane protein assembly factor BamB